MTQFFFLQHALACILLFVDIIIIIIILYNVIYTNFMHKLCMYTHMHTHIVPSSPPANVTVLSVMATSVTLAWEAPPLGTLNGLLIGYTFQCLCHPRVMCPSQSCPQLHHSVPASEDEREMFYQFEDLLPFMNYTFQVAAETSAGSGPFSFSVTMETEQTG
jgi:hypothetical protein